MFTIRRGKEYYSLQGGFVGLEEYQQIKWFPLYLPASQLLGHLEVQCRTRVQVVNAQEVIDDLLTSIMAIAPELFSLLQSLPVKPEDMRRCLEEAAARGGILEVKAEADALRKENHQLKERDKQLTLEAEKLAVVMADYEKLVKRQS